MKLSLNGPDFPASFLNRLQRDKVVFFCGAGVSMRSGLPDFKGLVKSLFSEFGEPFSEQRDDYDRMLEELEKDRFEGEERKKEVRKRIRNILAPDEKISDCRLKNHINILRLATIQDKDGGMDRVRLVTTNFDNRFQQAADSVGLSITSDNAPKFPMPEDKEEWASLVHLHGQITKGDRTLNSLVLTSSDFGRAYLVQGWARRFVVQLLREWYVVFVGYGLNDPLMRYLMDAAAAIRQRNRDSFRESYAFVSCEAGREKETRTAWEEKGITTPILYNKDDGDGTHSLLWKALDDLADFKKNPLRSRENNALMGIESMPEHDNTEQVIWSLKDPATANTFAKRKFFSDTADGEKLVDWLDVFKKEGLFKAGKAASVDALDCPPHSLYGMNLPPVAEHLIAWAARHAHQPALLWWLASSHGSPHSQFLSRLYYFVNMEGRDKGMTEELAEKWNLYIQEQLTSPPYGLVHVDILGSQNKSEWVESNQEQLLLAALRPRPRVIPATFFWEPKDRRQFKTEITVDCEMDRMGQEAYSAKERVKESKFVMAHAETLAAHLEDAASLMKRCNISTFSLRCFRPEEDDHYEIPHWLFLTLRVRDAVLDMIKGEDISRFKKLVSRWTASEHLLLRRLALFTITETAKFPEQTRLPIDWGAEAITTRPDMLWARESRRESCRFLRKAGAGISPRARAELERIVCKGPPHSKNHADLPDEDITRATRWAVAKFLAKLELSGAKLSPESARTLADARKDYPEQKFEEFMEYHRSKIVTWQADDSDDPGWPDIPKQPMPKWAEMPIEECAKHIQSVARPNAYSLIKNHPDKAIEVFEILARRGFWKEREWSPFLGNFDWNQNIPDDIAVRLIRLLEAMPDESARALARDCARTMQIISRTQPFSELERAWHRAWEFDLDLSPAIPDNHHTSQLDIAINHAHGQLAEIPLNCLRWKEEREKLLDVLAKILASEKPSHEYGKIAVGGRLSPLFHDFPEWTRQNLLPFFQPDNSIAFGMWEAFLYHPGMSVELLAALKPGLTHFLQRADDFHHRASNLVGIFVIGGLLYPEIIPRNEKRRIIAEMSPQGIQHLCWYMERELRDGDSAARAKIWRERIFPFLQDVRPGKHRTTGERSDISQALVSLVILTGDAFPEAFEWVKDFLSPIAGQGHGMHSVRSFLHGREEHAKNIQTKFPQECLFFLDRIVPNQGFPLYIRDQLHPVLDNIKDVAPDLEKRREFVRLRNIASGG